MPAESPRKELPGYDFDPARPAVNRATTFEGPTQLHHDYSPPTRVSRVPSDNLIVRNQRAQLRPLARATPENDLFSDPSDVSTFNSNSSPDRSYMERSVSPATSHGSAPSRNASCSTLAPAANGNPALPTKKKPPPPPLKSKETYIPVMYCRCLQLKRSLFRVHAAVDDLVLVGALN